MARAASRRLSSPTRSRSRTRAGLYGTLTLTKQVSGTQADADKAFDFTVTLEDGAGAPLSGTVDYTVADNGRQRRPPARPYSMRRGASPCR